MLPTDPDSGPSMEPSFLEDLEPRPLISAAPETAAGPGRMLAVVLLIAIAFGGGVAVDQAAWRGSNAGPIVTPGPLPTSVVRPPSTSAPQGSPGPGSAVPGTAVPGTPGTPAPTPRVTPGPTIGPGATVPPYAPANITILWNALKLIEEHFVRRDILNPTDLTYGAINGLVDALGDPGHTVFLTPDEVKSENESLSGQITGIGVYLGEQGGAPCTQSVVSGSPAARAGPPSADRIIAIDGTSAENLSVEEIARLVRGPEGT